MNEVRVRVSDCMRFIVIDKFRQFSPMRYDGHNVEKRGRFWLLKKWCCVVAVGGFVFPIICKNELEAQELGKDVSMAMTRWATMYQAFKELSEKSKAKDEEKDAE